MIIQKQISQRVIFLIKAVLLIVFVISLTSCAASRRHRSPTDRKRGLMLLENTSQALNKKFKKSKYARKSARRHKRGRGLR